MWFRRRLVNDESTNLGSVLLRMGLVTREQIKDALDVKTQQEEMLFGKILVTLGYISDNNLTEALRLQKKLRNGGAVEAMCEINGMLVCPPGR